MKTAHDESHEVETCLVCTIKCEMKKKSCKKHTDPISGWIAV